MLTINKTVLMSGAEYFSDQFAINAHMDARVPVNVDKAIAEHKAIQEALESAGIKVIKTPAPVDCQDGVYTANWALCRGNKALLSLLPNKRQAESPYAERALRKLGKEVITLPKGIHFSGQGDALPCGNRVFVGSNYRTSIAAWMHIHDLLAFEVIGLQTIPKRSMFGFGKRVINTETGWPDSYYYDIDLALAVLREDLIAYCPDVFVPSSRKLLASLPIQKIIVSRREATKGFACNLVSTGETVIMSARAPKLKAAIEAHGLKTITPEVNELGKGGGYIRCTTLTLDNA
ncbi:MAG TPA: arginine deiminase-related protein [Patescibacteria group bacterium]|nr:arginine deiminase-related protein [Patescibacteria group bacterium]